MVSYTDIPSRFPGFAKAFTNNVIKFNDQTPVDIVTEPISVVTSISLPASGQSVSQTVEANTFTINTFILEFAAGNTFTMTWKPSTAGTTLYFRKSPNAPWTPLRTQGVPVTLACGSAATVDIYVLFTTTSDADEGSSNIIMTSKKSKKCKKCKRDDPSSCPIDNDIDPCLVGTWNMDLKALKAAEEALLAKPTESGVSNIQVSGSAVFEVPASTSTSTFTFNHLTTGFDNNVEGMQAHEIADVYGHFTATVTMGAAGRFSWTDITGQGAANATVIFADGTNIAPIIQDIPIADSFSGVGYDVSYTCSDSKLVMSGSIDGKSTWVYSVDKGQTA